MQPLFIIKNAIIKFFVLIDYLKQLTQYTCRITIRRKLASVRVLNTEDSIDYIIRNGCSLSRYGDGEFSMAWQYITGKPYINESYFQQYNKELGKRLAKMLQQTNFDNKKHAVGISYSYYKGLRGMVFDARRYLMYFINSHHSLLLSSINIDRLYLNSELTRFYITRKDKKRSRRVIQQMSKIWESRNICFIEGEKSRLGIGNDLFENAKSIKRILCPAEGAYDKYNEIINKAKEQPKDTLFLLALGMTATIMAYDLSLYGFQAIDLGHVDIEYEWMRMGVKQKVPIPNKYTNEAEGGKRPGDIVNTIYETQIIARIGC